MEILVVKHDRNGFWAQKEINIAGNHKLSQKTISIREFSKRFKSIHYTNNYEYNHLIWPFFRILFKPIIYRCLNDIPLKPGVFWRNEKGWLKTDIFVVWKPF